MLFLSKSPSLCLHVLRLSLKKQANLNMFCLFSKAICKDQLKYISEDSSYLVLLCLCSQKTDSISDMLSVQTPSYCLLVAFFSEINLRGYMCSICSLNFYMKYSKSRRSIFKDHIQYLPNWARAFPVQTYSICLLMVLFHKSQQRGNMLFLFSGPLSKA